MTELDFPFEELPLVTDGAFEALLANGCATIRYYPDGEWFVGDIRLDAHRESTAIERAKHGCFVRGTIAVDDTKSWLYTAIWSALSEKRGGDIAHAVREALDREGVAIVPEHVEHSTHHNVLQGIV